jgi:hypothetical protein
MKKIAVVLIILVLLGGTAFFFGWMNIWVPAGSYGVMISKTSGFDDTLIGPASGFVWRWQHLIPTNVTLHVFTLADYTVPLAAKGRFPSGEVYAQAAPFAPDFSYEINFTVSYRLRFQALSGLVRRGELTPANMTAYLEKKKDVIIRALLEDIVTLTDQGEVAMLKNPFALEKSLLALANERSADIELVRLAPSGEIKIPDPAIYYEARRTYQTLLEEHRKLELEKMRRAQALFEREDMAFERSVTHLERYGELLNKYPVLLKYLYLTKNPPPAGIEVPELKNLFPTETPAAP